MSDDHPRHGEEDARPTRRQALRRFWAVGLLATASAGIADLFMVGPADAETSLPSVPISAALSALPADAPPGLVQAIADGCCITYTRDEGACTPSCPSGQCCYHVTGCGYNYIACIEVSCAKGNFTTGC
jgi:hypothetical protein